MSGRLVLLRHGQTYANVDKRLDTRPPGAELTPLGRDQARDFGRNRHQPPGLLAHSTAIRARQTAGEVGDLVQVAPRELDGLHEVQVGDLENRNDEAAIEEFGRIYQQWHEGDLDAAMPGGESANDVLTRYVPVLTDLRMRYLDNHDWTEDIVVVSHGAAIRLVGAILGGVDGTFALDHHLANTESVVLAPITDGRWSCLQWGALTPPFYPEPDAAGADRGAQEAKTSADPMG